VLARRGHSVRGQTPLDASTAAERDVKAPVGFGELFAAAQVEQVSRGERDLQAADVAPGRPVLKSARARSVRRNSPAEVAARLGRVGRVEQAARADLALKLCEHDARARRRTPAATFCRMSPAIFRHASLAILRRALTAGSRRAVFLHNLDDAVQPLGRKHYPAEGHAPADDARARARDRNGRALARRLRERFGYLLRALRQKNARRPPALHVARVGEEGLNLVLL
jgi:hypothetical protein